MKYLRLLRFQDQYIQLGFAVAAGIYINIKGWWVIYWAISVTCVSITAFILNELTDRHDVDNYSWNRIHKIKTQKFNNWIILSIYSLFSILGLLIAYSINLFAWGLIMYLVGLFYSLKPVRLKGRFILDIIAQLTVWFIIPFLAPVILATYDLSSVLPFVITMSCVTWSIFYPYQLSDYMADKKGGIRPTHVVLGMRSSLILGLIFGIIGVIYYFYLNIYQTNPWTFIFILLEILVIFLYLKWLKMKSLNDQLKSMQTYVRRVKPLTQLLVPYLLVFYFL